MKATDERRGDFIMEISRQSGGTSRGYPLWLFGLTPQADISYSASGVKTTLWNHRQVVYT